MFVFIERMIFQHKRYCCMPMPVDTAAEGLGSSGALPVASPVPPWPLPCVCGDWEARGWIKPHPLDLVPQRGKSTHLASI